MDQGCRSKSHRVAEQRRALGPAEIKRGYSDTPGRLPKSSQFENHTVTHFHSAHRRYVG